MKDERIPEDVIRELKRKFDEHDGEFPIPDGVQGIHFDKNGKTIGLFEWMSLSEMEDYRRIGGTKLKNGYFVSTVWLGIDIGIIDRKPIIFETMVFPSHDMAKYSTLEQAKKGHEKMVLKYKNRRKIKCSKK